MALGLVVTSLLHGCSPGETDLTHPGSVRELSADPVVLAAPWAEDRVYRPKLRTGAFISLLLVRDIGVHSDLYLKFDLEGLEDSAAVVAGELDLTVFQGTENGVRLEAFLVDSSAGDWVESEIPLHGLPTHPEPFGTSDGLIAPSGTDDPVTVSGALTIPGEILSGWLTDPESNFGFAVRVDPADIGYLNIASSEASVDTTVATVSTAGLRLLLSEGQGPGTLLATDDGYQVFDTRPVESVTEPTVFVEQQIPHRTLFRVDVDDLMIPVGSTVHRAKIELSVVPGTIADADTFLIGVYRNTSDWDLDVEPDTVDVGSSPTDFSTVSASVESLSLDFGDAMQDWLDGELNFGLTVRILSEGSGDSSLRFYSTEADSSAPVIRVEYSTPPPPRWEEG